MQAGQGSISKANKNTPSGAPFPANSADNGLSVDPVTGRIVLGNDAGGTLAALLSNREIPLDGFTFTWGQGNPFNGNFALLPDPVEDTIVLSFATGVTGINESAGVLISPNNVTFQANNVLTGGQLSLSSTESLLNHSDLVRLASSSGGGQILAELGAGRYIDIDGTLSLFQFGDIDSIGTGLKLMIDDQFDDVFIRNTAARFLDIRPTLGQFFFGDINGTVNGTRLEMDDQLESILFKSSGGNDFFEIDVPNGRYQFGDIQGTANGLAILMDDTNQRTVIDDNLGEMLFLDRAGSRYAIGDIDSASNGSHLLIDDADQKMEFVSTLGRFLSLDKDNDSYAMGDLNSMLNGGLLGVDDAGNLIVIQNNASNMVVEINGVTGFTGTVTPVTSITVNGGIVTAVA